MWRLPVELNSCPIVRAMGRDMTCMFGVLRAEGRNVQAAGRSVRGREPAVLRQKDS